MDTPKEYVDAAKAIAQEMRLEASCVSQAILEMRGHLDALDALLTRQEYERASNLGYQELSTTFVYIQRCLGGVQALYLDEQLLIQELAIERQCSDEEALASIRALTPA